MSHPSGLKKIFSEVAAMTGSASSKIVRNMFPNGALESEYTELDGLGEYVGGVAPTAVLAF
jgi:hypothetical protein